VTRSKQESAFWRWRQYWVTRPRHVRGQGDALRWDLLLAKAEAAAIAEPGKPNDHREAILEWVGRLPPHLNPVRAKAKELQALRTDAFWQTPTFAQLDAMRTALRDVMELAERPDVPPPMLKHRSAATVPHRPWPRRETQPR